MKPWPALLLALVACDSKPPAPPVTTYDLRWKLQPGQTFWIETKTNSDQGSKAVGDVPPSMILPQTKYETRSLTEVLVLNEGPAGEFGLRLTPLEFMLKGSVDGTSIELEYKNGEWVVEKVGEQRPDSKINVKEKVRELKESSSRSVNRRFGKSSTREPGKKSAAPPLPLSWPALPPEPVVVGARWVESTGFGPVFANLKGEELQTSNVLKKINGDTALIDGSLYDESSAKEVKLKVKRERLAEYDLKSGRFVKMSDVGEMINTGSLPEAAGRYEVWYRMTAELNLLDKR